MSDIEKENLNTTSENNTTSPESETKTEPKKFGLFSAFKHIKQSKQKALKDEEMESRGIPKKNTEKPKLEEKPKFFKSKKFLTLMIIAGVVLVGIIAAIVIIASGSGSKKPATLSFSQSSVYSTSGEDITLSVSFDSKYKGENKNIHLSVSAGEGIVDISKPEVKSGDSFKIYVKTQNGKPVGGMARIWAVADVDNSVCAYVDVIIDRPVELVSFNNTADSAYILDEYDFEATAYLDSTGTEELNLFGESIGRVMTYNVYYVVDDYDESIDPDSIIEIDGYNCIEIDGDVLEGVVSIEGNKLTPEVEGTFFIKASISKWAETDEESREEVFAIKKITSTRIDITSLALQESGTKYGTTYKFSELLNIETDSKFTQAQINSSKKYLEIECLNNSVDIIETDDGFNVDFGGVTTEVTITIKYKNPNGNELAVSFESQKKES